ncbi:MAG: hypothetical protein IJJ26_12815 [Victivallales bacterium]|nr:hypothetical protein [Victivallales bacterium]
MDFFSKHYEKLVLAGCLLCLLVAIILVASSNSKTQIATSEETRLAQDNVRGGNLVKPIDATTFEPEKVLKESRINLNVLGGEKSGAKGSLIEPIKYIICANDKCKKMISLYDDKCPFCGEIEPELAKKTGADEDTDSDGMPDIFEKQYPSILNYRNPNDAKQDADSDGFLNIEEYKNGTGIDDPDDFPPIACLFRALTVERRNIPFKLVDIDTNHHDDDPSRWDVAVFCYHHKKRKMARQSTQIGQVIANYKILRGGIGATPWIEICPEKNPSEVYRCELNKDVPNKNLSLRFMYLASRHKYDLRVLSARFVMLKTVGEIFRFQKQRSSSLVTEYYRLESCDENTGTAKIALLKDPEGKEVERVIDIPVFNKDNDFMYESPNAREGMGEEMPPDDMGPGPRRMFRGGR